MTAISIVKLGPGLWFSIHFQAVRAVDPEGKMQFTQFINQLLINFPCTSCVEHFRSFLSANPLINYWHVERGLFKWSVKFHNSVNEKLGKAVMSYSDALNTYHNSEPCNNCVGTANGAAEDDVIIVSSEAQMIPSDAVPVELLNYLASKH